MRDPCCATAPTPREAHDLAGWLVGQSSLDVAQEKGHDEVTRMLHVWTDAWSGWDAEEPWVTLPPRYLLRGGRDPGVVNTHSTPNTVKSEKIMRCATLLGK